MQKKKGFTLIELLVVIAIISVLVGLLLPAVQGAREAANRIKCANNLKQIGLGMHLYADANGRLPPTRTAYASGTWAVLILPYLEQGNLFQTWDPALTYYEQAAIARQSTVPIYFCPSHRTADNGVSVSGDTPSWLAGVPNLLNVPGALSDYALLIDRSGSDTGRNEPPEVVAAFTPPPPPDDSNSGGSGLLYSSGVFGLTGSVNGTSSGGTPHTGTPLIIIVFPQVGGGEGVGGGSGGGLDGSTSDGPPPPPPDPLDLIQSYGVSQRATSPTLGSFQKGLSQTILVGEKQVPQGKEGNGLWDCSTYNGNYFQCSTRTMSRFIPLTTDPQDQGWKFGSRHKTVVQFCFGDGHVQGLPVGTAPRTLELLAVPNDDEVIPNF